MQRRTASAGSENGSMFAADAFLITNCPWPKSLGATTMQHPRTPRSLVVVEYGVFGPESIECGTRQVRRFAECPIPINRAGSVTPATGPDYPDSGRIDASQPVQLRNVCDLTVSTASSRSDNTAGNKSTGDNRAGTHSRSRAAGTGSRNNRAGGHTTAWARPGWA